MSLHIKSEYLKQITIRYDLIEKMDSSYFLFDVKVSDNIKETYLLFNDSSLYRVDSINVNEPKVKLGLTIINNHEGLHTFKLYKKSSYDKRMKS